MTLNITAHAYLRYIERTMNINLDEFKKHELKDHEILDYLNADRNDLSKNIIKDMKKTKNILKVIGGNNIDCIIGIGTTHKAVFHGSTVVTILNN